MAKYVKINPDLCPHTFPSCFRSTRNNIVHPYYVPLPSYGDFAWQKLKYPKRGIGTGDINPFLCKRNATTVCYWE